MVEGVRVLFFIAEEAYNQSNLRQYYNLDKKDQMGFGVVWILSNHGSAGQQPRGDVTACPDPGPAHGLNWPRQVAD